MNYINRFNSYRFILFLGILLSLSACKSSKNIVSTSGALTDKSQTELLDNVISSQMQYNTLSGKVSVSLAVVGAKSELKTASYIKIVRDKAIQISVRPFLNREVMRLSITPDSIYLIDRLNKQYGAESIADIAKSGYIDINFNNIQALLTNALFAPGKTAIDKKDYSDYKVLKASDVYMIQTKGKPNVKYNFAIDSSDRIVSTLIMNDKSQSIQWSYSDFIKEANNLYPTTHNIDVNINNKQLKMSISYPSLDIDKEVNVDNDLPAKYQRTSIKSIISNYLK